MLWKCLYCNIERDIRPSGIKGHLRWCKDNPEKDTVAKKIIKLSSSSMISRRALGWRPPKHTEETKEKIRKVALNSKHRRLVKSTREYKCVDGSMVLLDSSWEEHLAYRLDSLNIKWCRPKNPIKWIDQKGKIRNYFPDFYLEDYDLYLDPKNPYAFISQQEKVLWLKRNISNLLFLKTEDECKTFRPLDRGRVF